MENQMKLVGFVLAVLLLVNNAVAGSLVGARVLKVTVDNSGYGYIEFNVNLTGGASCGSALPNALTFNANSAGGKGILATALTAKATNVTMTAIGTNACAIYGTVEEMYYGTID
jgi:hypothetical protein